jgi:hypothetical protein
MLNKISTEVNARLQQDFRAVDSEFQELGMMQERQELFEGAVANSDDPARMTNSDLLNKASNIQDDNVGKLKDALQTVEMTKVVANETAGRLQEDEEKMKRTMLGLDNVESELVISQKLITNFVKRLYTDKVIIAFTFLILAGVVGIIVYATLNPDQKVPDTMPTSLHLDFTRTISFFSCRYSLYLKRRSHQCFNLPLRLQHRHQRQADLQRIAF